MREKKIISLRLKFLLATVGVIGFAALLMSSSHREAPLIANDPLADNTDLYAFKSPQNPDKMIIIANYSPAELAYGGPNYSTFGTDVRYEIHVDNNKETSGDDKIGRASCRERVSSKV